MRLAPLTWGATAARHLARIAADVTAEWYAAEVAAGRATLLAIMDGARHVATAVVRIETGPGGREIVLVACGGDCDPGRVRLPGLLKLGEILGQAANCNSARLHTRRRGLVRLARGQGWRVREIRPDETVLSKDLA